MAQKKQVIRKVDPVFTADFDEQLWPILLVLAGFATGAIVATANFDGGPWYWNGWFQLSALAVALLGLLVFSLWLPRRRAVRRMQLAVLLSLLVNLVIQCGLYYKELTVVRKQTQQASEWIEETEWVTLPDYGRQPSDNPTEELERPVETQTPDTQARETVRQDVQQPTPVNKPAEVEPAVTARQQPTPTELQRTQSTATPRQSTSQTGPQASRQELKSAQVPVEQAIPLAATAPSANTAQAAEANVSAPRATTEVPRQATLANQTAAESPTRSTATAQLPERQATPENAPQLAESTPTTARPAARAQIQPDAVQTAANAANNSKAPAPQQASLASPGRQATQAPSLASAVSSSARESVSPNAATTARTLPQRAQSADAMPQNVAAQVQSAARSANSPAPSPSASPNQVASQASPAESTASHLQPGLNSAAARSAATAPANSTLANQAGSAPAANQTAQVSAANLQRAAATSGRGDPAGSATASPQAAGRTATSQAPGATLSAAAELQANTVAEAGGAPAPSANAAATNQSRSHGAVPLVQSRSAVGQPVAGQALNAATGSASQPRRAETSSNPNLRSPAPGAGQVARSQGDAANSLPAASVALAAENGSAGAISAQPSTGPQTSLVGAARANGNMPGLATGQSQGSSAPAGAPNGQVTASGLGQTAPSSAGSSGPALANVGQRAPTRTASGAGSGPADSAAPAAVAQSGDGAASNGEPGGALQAATGSAPRAATTGAGAVGAGNGSLTAGGGSVGALAAAVGTGRARAERGPAVGPAGGGSIGRSNSSREVGTFAADTAGPIAATAGNDAGPAGIVANTAGTTAARSPTSGPGSLSSSISSAQPAGNGIGASVTSSTVGSAPARTELAPQLAASGSGAAVGRTATVINLPTGVATADEAGPVAGAGDNGAAANITVQVASLAPARASGGALPIQSTADLGPGGVSARPTPQLPNLPNRQGNPDSEIVRADSRFLGKTSRDISALGRVLDVPAPAFIQRSDQGQRQDLLKSRGGSSGTERAVEMGLEYLAKQQLPGGRWSLQQVAGNANSANAGPGQMEADTAATGLALLCFLGANHTHRHGAYRDVVDGGLGYLIKQQKSDGDLFTGGSKYAWFYSHGIASIALCEAYGMTGDPALREPAQKALDFIIASQHPSEGGWRYAPQTGTDTSVSGWQVMALRSGELAGLEVPSETYTRVSRWLDGAQGAGQDASKYRYRPASEVKHQNQPSPAMTAEGLLMRYYTGWQPGDPRFLQGAAYLQQHLPSVGTRQKPERDAYFWYYATQFLFQVQGEPWEQWNNRLRPLLTTSQVQQGPLAGSWDPRAPITDRWGIEAGRLYVTAMHLLMLEVYYRHLPLNQLPANR